MGQVVMEYGYWHAAPRPVIVMFIAMLIGLISAVHQYGIDAPVTESLSLYQ